METATSGLDLFCGEQFWVGSWKLVKGHFKFLGSEHTQQLFYSDSIEMSATYRLCLGSISVHHANGAANSVSNLI